MPSLPQTYKAVVLTEANSPFNLVDVELKHPEAGQVLVKVAACGVCYISPILVFVLYIYIYSSAANLRPRYASAT